jgi:hypothetical protein
MAVGGRMGASVDHQQANLIPANPPTLRRFFGTELIW